MIASGLFPRLTALNHRPTSASSAEYNCVAWAAGDTAHWWQPGVYWPVETAPEDFGIAVLELAFRSLGYEDCGADEGLEAGFEKVALYGGTTFYTHAALQKSNGKWSSKQQYEN